MKSYNLCLGNDPNHHIAWYNRGLILNENNYLDNAILSFMKCVEYFMYLELSQDIKIVFI